MPDRVDAQPPDRVARPAAAVALQFQRLFGSQNAPAAHGVGLKQEIALLAEQPEAVAHFPRDLHRALGRGGVG